MHYFKLENTHTQKKTQIQEDIMRQKEMKRKMQMRAEWLKFPLLNQFARQTNTNIHVARTWEGGGEGGETGILASPTECLCGPQAFNSVSTVVRVIKFICNKEIFFWC